MQQGEATMKDVEKKHLPEIPGGARLPLPAEEVVVDSPRFPGYRDYPPMPKTPTDLLLP
jgi:hypothetical protein